MQYLQKTWNNFKVQPEIWFFYGFLLTSMLSVRKVLFDYPLAGSFNEYTGRYIYLSDLFLFATLIVWIISILYNKNTKLSIYSPSNVPHLPREPKKFPVEHFRFLRGETFYILGIFLAWVLISISWADRPEIGYFKFFKLFELAGLFLFLALNPKCSTPEGMFHPSQNVPRGTSDGTSVEHPTGQAWNILRNIFRIIIFIGVINAPIGIFQFVLQHSLGFFWLKESLISADLPGVAKIVFGGLKYIRAYGLFPHPNILGGFLLLSIILTWAYKEMFYKEHLDTTRAIWKVLLGIQIIGLILTFSKSAWLGLVVAMVYILFHPSQNVPRGTSDGTSMEQLKNLKECISTKKWLIIGIFLVLLALAYINLPDLKQFLFKSLNERLLYLEAAKNMILAHPLFGIGAGQFVPEMSKYLLGLLDWQYQPVHNVFLLIWAELGLIGLTIFCWFIFNLFQINKNISPRKKLKCSLWNILVSRGKRGTIDSRNNLEVIFKAILAGFFIIALFDHYFWDIQQGQVMFWLVLGLLVGAKTKSC